MKHSRDVSDQIAKHLAAVESDLAQLRQKLRVLDAKRERLRTAQARFRQSGTKNSADLGKNPVFLHFFLAAFLECGATFC
jgi:hypothetical protein